MRKNTKVTIFISLLFLIFLICVWKLWFGSNDEQLKGIENLRLKGIVYCVMPSINNGRYHGTGIIRLKILNSNIHSYDPRGRQKVYYCIIKEGKAEIYTGLFAVVGYQPTIGDTILLNIKKRNLLVIKQGDTVHKFGTSIHPYTPFYEYIKEHGYQKL